MNYKHGRNIRKYNEAMLKNMTLRKGNEWCNKCDGLGYITYEDGDFRSLCFTCKGLGQINWVDKLIPGRINNV